MERVNYLCMHTTHWACGVVGVFRSRTLGDIQGTDYPVYIVTVLQ